MPKFDGTGPLGYGMGTGRRMGPCCSNVQNFRGFNCGRRFLTKKEEEEVLKEEIENMEKETEALKERLSEIEGQK